MEQIKLSPLLTDLISALSHFNGRPGVAVFLEYLESLSTAITYSKTLNYDWQAPAQFAVLRNMVCNLNILAENADRKDVRTVNTFLSHCLLEVCGMLAYWLSQQPAASELILQQMQSIALDSLSEPATPINNAD